MQTPSRYAPLFEPLRIGPKVAPNRFYQVPHCTGMGYMAPKTVAAMRATKAEGGWGVVSTEYCSIHPSSDDSPYAFLTLWDDEDVRALAKTAEVIQKGGALAALELWHGGFHSNNRLTREPLLAPGHFNAEIIQPGAARAMDLSDIRKLIGWQKDAARRAVRAGFDIVYVYASHDYLPFQFLSRRFNQRSDAYGGSLENRARLLRQMIEATREGVGDKAAVAVRLAVDGQDGPGGFTAEGEGRAVVEMLAELPDLWDVNIGGAIANDSRSARFSNEAFQEDFVRFVKKVTSKPVVGVGRFTSPDTMLRQIKDGILDFIGAARPSIADPFLPLKIKEGREDEIRECIGCNICRSANNLGVPLRCTQNPTIGEGWRRGWHPEKIEPRHGDQTVLVVGGGPAGLEAARALGQRGYRVTLCEKDRTLGGRLLKESSLPGLSTWIRVRDWRETMIGKLEKVEVFRESPLTAEDVRAVGADHVLLATGASWRRDGLGARNLQPLAFPKEVLTPDDVFTGASLEKDLLIYDDEHFVMAGALAERLALAGYRVTYLSSEPLASSWTVYTDDQHFIQKRLIDLGVRLVLSQRLVGAADGKAHLSCAFSGKESALDYGSLILATGRLPNDRLAVDLADLPSLRLIGDCLQPSSVADAVYSGHRAARELGATDLDHPPKRERPDA